MQKRTYPRDRYFSSAGVQWLLSSAWLSLIIFDDTKANTHDPTGGSSYLAIIYHTKQNVKNN